MLPFEWNLGFRLDGMLQVLEVFGIIVIVLAVASSCVSHGAMGDGVEGFSLNLWNISCSFVERMLRRFAG